MPPIQRLAVVGAGYMGAQIALQHAAHGLDLALTDTDQNALDNAARFQGEELARRQREQRLDATQAATIQKRIAPTTDLEEAVDGADMVIEAIPERLDLKRRLFTRLDALCPPETLLATNSSSLRCAHLEEAVQHPQRLLNFHFYGRIWDRPIVDIMGGNHTPDTVIQNACALARRINVVPLVARKQSTGFVFNRVWRAVKKETLHLVDQGVADFEDVDRAWMIGFGVKMGPFAMMDAVGLDVVQDIEEVYHRESGDPSDAPPAILTERVDRGDLGVKSGRGFYTYPDPAFARPDWLKGADGT